MLQFTGFKLNEEKSFFGDEPFRESCGGDYFAGKPVRPFYLKEEPVEPAAWMSTANGIYRIIETLNGCGGSHWDLGNVRTYCLDQLPHWVRSCRGPKALGDAVIWEDDVDKWRTRTRWGIRYFKAYVPRKYRLVRYSRFHADVVLACATYGLGGSQRGGVTPRDGLLESGVGWVAYS